MQVRSRTSVACVRKRSVSRRTLSLTDIVMLPRSGRSTVSCVDTRSSASVTCDCTSNEITRAPADHVTYYPLKTCPPTVPHRHSRYFLPIYCHRRRLFGCRTSLYTPTPVDHYYFRPRSMTSLWVASPAHFRCMLGRRRWLTVVQNVAPQQLRTTSCLVASRPPA